MANVSRGTAVRLGLVLAAALALRLYFAWNYTSHNPHRALGTIPFLFESGNIAHSLATGGGFASPFRVDTGPTAWMTPAYPLILAGIFQAFGTYTFAAFAAAIGLNILASVLTCVPVYFAGRRLAGEGVATAAAWMWAVFPNSILLAVESVWDASLAALVAALLLIATLRQVGRRGWLAWWWYGMLWGAALMINATLGSMMPLMAGWAAWQGRGADRKWLGRLAVAALAAALCCAPWTIRNYRVFHAFVPLRSVLGLQLWMGNSELAKDVWLGEGHPIRDTAEREKYVAMGEIAYMRQKRDLALVYMREHPARELHLITRRMVAIWSGGTTDPISYWFQPHSWWSRGVLLFNLLAAIGMAAGVVILWRRRSVYAFPASVLPVVYPCAYYLTLALPRYRLPIDPVVLLLASVALAAVPRGRSRPA